MMKHFAARSTRPSVFTTSTWRIRVRVRLASLASPRRVLRKKPLRKRIFWLSSRYMTVPEPCHWSVYQSVFVFFSSRRLFAFPSVDDEISFCLSSFSSLRFFFFLFSFISFYFYFPFIPLSPEPDIPRFPKSSVLVASSERPISLWDSHSFFFFLFFFNSFLFFDFIPIPSLCWNPMFQHVKTHGDFLYKRNGFNGSKTKAREMKKILYQKERPPKKKKERKMSLGCDDFMPWEGEGRNVMLCYAMLWWWPFFVF